MIVGRPLGKIFPEMPAPTTGSTALEVRHLRGGPLRDVSFAVEPGEVVGIAGLLGSGRTSLLRMLFGAMDVAAGEILLGGEPVRFRHPNDAIASGVGFVPEDRARDAAFSDLSVLTNVSAAVVSRYWRRGRFEQRRERDDGDAVVADFRIKTRTLEHPLSTLSGGNQQKVVLARWLRRSPRVLLLDEPTQGVDVAARADIYELIRDAVERGTSVLVVASDFEELAGVCDRVLVLGDGTITADVRRPIDAAELAELAYTSPRANR
jgi:ribose transport system ATP-binding protein